MTDKITIERETLQAALEALTESVDLVQNDYDSDWRHGMPTRKAQLDASLLALNQHRAAIDALRAAMAAQTAEQSMRPLPNHDNHHNALKCPYCNPRGLKFAEPADAQPKPVAWKHDCAGLCANDVELWIDACPHCGKPRTAQPAPATMPPEGEIVVSKNEAGQIVCVSRQDEDGQFLSIIAESADAVPLTPKQYNMIPELCAIKPSLYESIVRAIERAHGIAAAGDKP